MNTVKKFAAEFVGTAIMIFTGIAVAISVNTMLSANSVGVPMGFSVTVTALAFGLGITAMYYCFGRISGANLNPAVSFGLMLSGKLSPVDFAVYAVAQIGGGIAGAGLVAAIMGTRETLFSSGYENMSTFGLEMWQAVIVDVVMTFALVTVYLNVSGKDDMKNPAGIIYGLTFAVVYMVEIPFTGGSSNPAKSIGAAIWQTNGDPLSQLWVFVAAPLLGAAIAAVFHMLMEYAPKTIETPEASETEEKAAAETSSEAAKEAAEEEKDDHADL